MGDDHVGIDLEYGPLINTLSIEMHLLIPYIPVIIPWKRPVIFRCDNH